MSDIIGLLGIFVAFFVVIFFTYKVSIWPTFSDGRLPDACW